MLQFIDKETVKNEKGPVNVSTVDILPDPPQQGLSDVLSQDYQETIEKVKQAWSVAA